MFHANENYLKLPGSYLFSTVARKVNDYSKAHPEASIIRLGIGDVTQPLCPAVIEALHKAVDEQASGGDLPRICAGSRIRISAACNRGAGLSRARVRNSR